MLLIATLAAAVASGGSNGQAPFRVFGGPTFEAFATATEATCPKVRARYATAGELAGWEEEFTDALPRAERAKIPIPRRCGRYNGLSCPASANLEAISRVGLMDRFVAFVCAHARRRR